jgi:hypothetical protein
MSAIMTSYVLHHGPMTFAAVLLTIVLCVADSLFTIEIVSRGGQELNPIMAYYLNQSPLLFFIIKYSLTCVAIILMLSIKNHYIRGIRIRAEVLLWSFIIVLALVVQWQLFLIYIATD